MCQQLIGELYFIIISKSPPREELKLHFHNMVKYEEEHCHTALHRIISIHACDDFPLLNMHSLPK
jgi:hypothetical protein